MSVPAMNFFHRAVSLRTMVPMYLALVSSGGSTPMSFMRARTEGCAIIAATAALSFSIASGGVPAGAARLYQVST